MAGLLDPNALGAPTENDDDSNSVGTLAPQGMVELDYDDIVKKLTDQATAASKRGIPDDKILPKLNAKIDAAKNMWDQYGPSAFAGVFDNKTPYGKPKDEITAIEKSRGPDAHDFEDVQSGVSSDSAAPSPDVMSEGAAQAEASGTESWRNAADAVMPLAQNYTPEGLLPMVGGGAAGILAGGYGKVLKDTTGIDVGEPADVVKKVEDELTYEPESKAGKKYAETMGLPWKAFQGGVDILAGRAENLGDTIDKSGLPGTGTVGPAMRMLAEVGGNIAPFVAGGKRFSDYKKAEPKVEDINPVKTGDKDIDAGVEAGMNYPSRIEPTQGDLFSPTSELGLDMFSKESVPAATIESRRAAQEAASQGELPQRSEDQNAQLEQDYLFDQQDRLNQGPPKQDIVAQRGAIPEQYLGIANTELPQGDVNTAMHRQMLQALADRGQLRNPDVPIETPEPTQGQIFEPTKNETVPQTAEQGQLELPAQQDLFGNEKSPSAGPEYKPVDTTKPQTPLEAKADNKFQQQWNKALEDSQSDDRDTAAAGMDKLEELQAQRAPNRPADATGASIPKDVSSDLMDKLRSGQLTGGHVLDALISNDGGKWKDTTSAFAKVLKQAAVKLGGLDTKIEHFDPNNPEHANSEGANGAEGAPGWYDPNINKVLLRDGKYGMHVMLHEVTHGVTEKALRLGEQGQLSGDSRNAYHTLQALFEEIQPEAQKQAGGNKLVSYGLTNLHELMSEMFSNGQFRDHLRSMPITDATTSAMSGLGRLALGKVRNMYEAVVGSVRNLLGLSPKANNMLDAMFSAGHNFLHSFDDSQAESIRKSNARNTGEVDPMAFLGERAEARFASKDEKDIYEAGLAPKKAIRSIRESVLGQTQLGKGVAADNAQRMNDAAQKEGVPNEALDSFFTQGNDDALNKYPGTKQEALRQRDQVVTHLSQNLISNWPEKTSSQQEAIRNAITENLGKYLTQFYRGTDYSKRVLDLADTSDKQGGPKTAEEKQAVDIRDNMRQLVRDRMLPGADLDKRPLSNLHQIADALDVDSDKIARDVKYANPNLKGLELGTVQKEAIRAAITKATPEESKLADLTDKLIRDIGGLNGANNPISKKYAGVRAGDIFAEKVGVSQPIADYMGQVKDVAARLAATQAKQYTGLAQLKGLQDLYTAGKQGGWVWDTRSEAPTGAVQMTGDKMGAMKDVYVDPKVQGLLEQQLELSKNTDGLLQHLLGTDGGADIGGQFASDVFGKGRSFFRGAKVFRQATGLKNYIMWGLGAGTRMLSHGNINPSAMGRGIYNTVKELTTGAPLQDADGNLTTNGRMVRAGLGGHSTLAEIGKAMRDSKLLNDLEQNNVAPGRSGWQVMKDLGSAAKDKLPAVLYAMDHWATQANFLDRVGQLENFYKRQEIDKTPLEIDREAADQMKNTNLDMSRLPKVFRYIEQSGLSISLPYVVEAHRNVINNGILGFKDVSRGISAGDAGMIANGIKRLAGTTAAVGFGGKIYGAVGGVMATMLGLQSKQVPEDDKRTAYLQDEGSRFRSGQATEVWDPLHPDAKNSFMWDPGGAFDPYYPINQPVSILADIAKNYNKSGYDTKKQLGRAMDEYTSILLTNPVTKSLMNAYHGKPSSMAYRDADAYNAEKQFLVETLGRTPETADRLLNLQEIATPQEFKDYQSTQDSDSAKVKAMSHIGWGFTKMPRDASLQDFESTKFKNSLQTARSQVETMVKSPSVYSDATLERQFVTGLKATTDSIEKVHDAADFARGSGLSEEDIYNKMKTAKTSYPKDVMMNALNLDGSSVSKVLYRNLESSLKDEVKRQYDDPEKQKQLLETYSKKMSQLQDLAIKYMSYTPQQIKDL